MTRRKPLAALAAVTAAVAVAIPTASASAATPTSVIHYTPPTIHYTPPITLCETLSLATQGALAVGNQLLADLITQASHDVFGCGGAAL